jgi:Flp pilus assembly pilin Flp
MRMIVANASHGRGHRVVRPLLEIESRRCERRRSRPWEVNHLLNLLVRLQTTLADLRRREDGQTMAEYGVVLGVLTIALVAVFGFLADDIEAAIDAIRAVLPG